MALLIRQPRPLVGGAWRSAVSDLALFAVVVGGHVVGQAVVYQFDHTPSSGVSFFPGDGVTLAALLLTASRRWPLIAGATFLAELGSHISLHEPLLTGVGLAASNTIGPLAGAWLVLWLLGHTPHLEDTRDLWVLLGAAVVGGPLVDALTGPPFARIAVHASPYLETMARWWTGDALGVLIVALPILAWAQPVRWPHPAGRHPPEAAACAGVLVAVSVLVFFVFTQPLAYLVLVPLGWAALRFGARGATTAIATLTVIAEFAVVTGHSQFAAQHPGEVRSALWLLQLFLAVTALAALVVASEVAHTRRAEAARLVSELAEQRAEHASAQAALNERARLARELHDSVSQALFAAAMHARSAEKQLTRSPAAGDPKLATDLEALRELTSAAQAEMRALIFEMRPESLATEGLVNALARQAAAVQARTGLPVAVTGPRERLDIEAAAEEHLYRIALEALNNTVKHAQATTISISVVDLGDAVELVVSDDGTGFDSTRESPGHLGLQTMRERAADAGGTLEVSVRVGVGTAVRCTVPTTQAR
jgi:signal transduction histidine kinase